MVIFQNLSKSGEMLKNVNENIKKNFAVIFCYTMDIKNTLFNPKFYQQFLPSLVKKNLFSHIIMIKLLNCSGFKLESARYFDRSHRSSSYAKRKQLLKLPKF